MEVEGLRHIFRAYDIRGKYGIDLNEDVSWAVGKAISRLFSPSLVVIGRDMRKGSVELAEALIKGLREEGVEVKYVGEVTTPFLYFASLQGDMGVMITASHNPPEYNGIKFISKRMEIGGAKIKEIGEEAISILKEEVRRGGAGLSGSEEAMAKKVENDRYIDEKELLHYIEFLRRAGYWDGGKRVIMDLGNGVVGNIVDVLVDRLHIDAELLFKEPDGSFPHHLADPVREETLKVLQERCKSEGVVGVAFDGDGDRIRMIDEDGEIVDNDKLLVILAQQEKERKGRKGRVVVELKVSRAVEEMLRKLGFEVVFSKTGHTNIKEKMRETDALLSMEISGHAYFNIDGNVYEDATLALLRILSYMKEKNTTLKALLSNIPQYKITPEIRIEVRDDKFKEETMRDIVSKAESLFPEAKRIIKIDGVKVEYERGWVMIRQSNTQPVINVRAEGVKKEDLKEIMERTRSVLERYGIYLEYV